MDLPANVLFVSATHTPGGVCPADLPVPVAPTMTEYCGSWPGRKSLEISLSSSVRRRQLGHWSLRKCFSHPRKPPSSKTLRIFMATPISLRENAKLATPPSAATAEAEAPGFLRTKLVTANQKLESRGGSELSSPSPWRPLPPAPPAPPAQGVRAVVALSTRV